MNAAQAKKISMYDLLSSLGQAPADTRKSGNEVWYRSPFREEKEPSFKIKLDQNVWYDFGEGEGGNIIDFVMKYNRCDFVGALSFLENNQIKPSAIRIKATGCNKEQTLDLFDGKSPLIIEVKPIYHFALKEYLRERGIPADVAYKHLKEIHYKVEEKQYFALGFPNRAGGWELRSSIFKGCIGKKDISLLQSNSQEISVFEGFMDYLSCITLNGEDHLKSDVLILNSTSMRNSAIAFIKGREYENANTYFDNDKAGLSTHELFCQELKNVNIISKNALYMPYKDYNDFLKQSQIKNIRSHMIIL